jgi:hypothetical protein
VTLFASVLDAQTATPKSGTTAQYTTAANLKANPLDYVEGGALDARRRVISLSLDSTNTDLNALYKRGGKLIVAIGTNDTLALLLAPYMQPGMAETPDPVLVAPA